MDQLVVLQEIYESFSKGEGVLHSLNSKDIRGSCSDQVAQLLEASRQGKIDADLCLRLAGSLQDVYEIKRLGDICRKEGLLELSIRCYNKALEMAKDKSFRPVLQNNLGQVYARYGDIPRAITYYKRAAQGFEAAGDASGLAHVLGNLGSACRKGQEWDLAIDYCNKSLKGFQDHGDDIGAAQMTGSLGRVYAEMGQKEMAIRYYETSLKDFQRLGDKRSTAWIFNRLGKIFGDNKDWVAALECYNKSLSIFNELGQEQSSAIVLSNLGRAYLDQEDAAAARECLERSRKNLRRDLQPAYQNATACLAAAYSLLAREHLNRKRPELSGCASPGDGNAEESYRLASQYYARASDRYLELASMPKITIPELYTAAHMARALHYLAALQAERKDEDAVLLADGAISSLQDAAASQGPERYQIEGILQILRGMKQMWSFARLRKEPWKLAKSVAGAVDQLISGAWMPAEACDSIKDALNGLKGAMEEERLRKDPSEKLRASVFGMRRAKSIFEADGTELGLESAIWLEKAATLLERLIEVETHPESPASWPHKNDLLNYRAHKSVLLLVGWVMVKNTLNYIDHTDYIYTWNDALRLVEKRSYGHSRAMPESQKLLERDMPAEEVAALEEIQRVPGRLPEIEPGESLTKTRLAAAEADGRIPAGAVFKDDDSMPEKSGLVPVVARLAASTCSAQAIRQPPAELKASPMAENIQPDIRGKAFDNDGREACQTVLPEEGGPDFDVGQTCMTKGQAEMQHNFGMRLPTKACMMKALMIIFLLCLALLALDVILYLI